MAVNLIAQIEARPDTVDDVKVLMAEYAAHVLSMEGWPSGSRRLS